MIISINEFKEDSIQLRQLSLYLMDWLDGSRKFQDLKTDNEFKELIVKYTDKFNYTGKVYRQIGQFSSPIPIDNNKDIKSFASDLEALCTILNLWQYGGMIDYDIVNLPVYVDSISGFSITSAINYFSNKDYWNNAYTYYRDYNEVIGFYKKPILEYTISTITDNTDKRQAFELINIHTNTKIKKFSNEYL